MTKGLAGRAIAMIGIILGLLAVGLDVVSAHGATSRYLDHGVVVAFLISTLAMASYLPAEVGHDSAGAAAGTAAFGFYLYIPAGFAFDHLGTPGAAAWLGLGTVLVPIGWAIVRAAERAHEAAAAAPPATTNATAALRDPKAAIAIAGVILLAAGIWLPVVTNGPSFWNGSFSGHALGIVLLIATLANAVALLGPLVSRIAVSPDATLLLAAGTFGLVAASWLQYAFSHLGSLGTGSWVEAVGGLLLIVGVLATRLGAARRAPAGAALAPTQ
jgi:hypothetical protein